MLSLKKLLLVTVVVLLGGASADARGRLIGRRGCVSPAPVLAAPQYQTIPPQGVPAIPPTVTMPFAGRYVELPPAPNRPLVQAVGQTVQSAATIPAAAVQGFGQYLTPATTCRGCR